MEGRTEVIRRLHQQAYTVINGFSSEVPAYDNAPSALVEHDMVHGTRLNVDLYFRYLQTRTMPTTEELGPLIELALMRQRDGVPLEDILAVYQGGATMIWDQLTAELAEQSNEFMLESAAALVRYLTTVTGRIAVACSPLIVSDHVWTRGDAKRAVATALLSGASPPPGTLDRAGPLAKAYVVAAFEPAPDSDPRILREIHTRTAADDGALTVSDPSGWTALIPVAASDVDGRAAVEVLEGFIPRSDLSIASPTFWAGVSAPATPTGIPAARIEAQTLCRTAQLLDRPDSLCVGDDVLFPYVVATARAAHPYLERVSDALRADSVAQETLWTFLDNGCNQLATAQSMHIHRNTVAYRLARVTKLTGHDPQDPEGSWVLAAARLHGRDLGSGTPDTDEPEASG